MNNKGVPVLKKTALCASIAAVTVFGGVAGSVWAQQAPSGQSEIQKILSGVKDDGLSPAQACAYSNITITPPPGLDAIDAYVCGIETSNSSCTDPRPNPDSSAKGPYQIIDDTFCGVNGLPKMPSPQCKALIARRQSALNQGDLSMEHSAWALHKKGTIAEVQRAGLPVTPQNFMLFHQLGGPAATKFAKGGPASSVLSSKTLTNNNLPGDLTIAGYGAFKDQEYASRTKTGTGGPGTTTCIASAAMSEAMLRQLEKDCDENMLRAIMGEYQTRQKDISDTYAPFINKIRDPISAEDRAQAQAQGKTAQNPVAAMSSCVSEVWPAAGRLLKISQLEQVGAAVGKACSLVRDKVSLVTGVYRNIQYMNSAISGIAGVDSVIPGLDKMQSPANAFDDIFSQIRRSDIGQIVNAASDISQDPSAYNIYGNVRDVAGTLSNGQVRLPSTGAVRDVVSAGQVAGAVPGFNGPIRAPSPVQGQPQAGGAWNAINGINRPVQRVPSASSGGGAP